MNGRRRLPIIIGGFEAQAIAIEIEKMTPTRPLTHDLFKSFAQSFSIQIQEVIIYNLVDGIFYAKLICIGGSKQQVEIDDRTSDRSEEHTSELKSLMRISYAVYSLKKKKST